VLHDELKKQRTDTSMVSALDLKGWLLHSGSLLVWKKTSKSGGKKSRLQDIEFL